MKINIGYLVSYDYSYIFTSLKTIYDHADQIVLSIDKERKTWSGNSFEIPDHFFEDIKKIDTRGIIEIYEDYFYVKDLPTIDCDTRQRNLTLKKLNSGWKIQLDVDEYAYDFEALKNYLKKYNFLTVFPKLTPIAIRGVLLTLYKIDGNHYFYIDNEEPFSFISNQRHFVQVRMNNLIPNFFCNYKLIHQSWARKPEEIKMKFRNWGHKDDFDTNKYFEYWNNLSAENYKEYINFHPIHPDQWKNLECIEANDIDDFIKKYTTSHRQHIEYFEVKDYFKLLRRTTGIKNKVKKLFSLK